MYILICDRLKRSCFAFAVLKSAMSSCRQPVVMCVQRCCGYKAANS